MLLALSAPLRAETTLDDLLNAAEMGHNRTVMEGVRRGMDVDSSDEAGVSLLMRAAREGNLELTDFLLRNRANVRARTSWGDTAMSLAGQKGHTEVIRRLLSKAAARSISRAGRRCFTPPWKATSIP